MGGLLVGGLLCTACPACVVTKVDGWRLLSWLVRLALADGVRTSASGQVVDALSGLVWSRRESCLS